MVVVSGGKPAALSAIPPVRHLSPDASKGVQTVPVAKKKLLSVRGGRVFSFRNDSMTGSKISVSRMFGWRVDILYDEYFGDKDEDFWLFNSFSGFDFRSGWLRRTYRSSSASSGSRNDCSD
jgi:hypothetical protein